MTTIPSLLSVSYPVLAGKESPFQEWLQQVNHTATKSPGFLGLGLDRGGSQSEPGQCKITYKFQTDALRDKWADSAERAQAHEIGRAFLVSERHESRISEGGKARVLMVATSRLTTSRNTEWNAIQEELNAAVTKYPGFESIDVFKDEGEDKFYTTVLTFQSEEDMQRWRDSEERQSILERAQGVSDDKVHIEPGAFGQWFSANATPSAPSPAWKQAMVVLLVLFPLVTLYDMTLGNAAGQGLSVEGHPVFKGLGIPFPAVVFLGNAFGTVLLTWVIMPVITRIFNWWLNPFASPTQTLRGSFLIVLLYVIEIITAVYIFKTWGF